MTISVASAIASKTPMKSINSISVQIDALTRVASVYYCISGLRLTVTVSFNDFGLFASI